MKPRNNYGRQHIHGGKPAVRQRDSGSSRFVPFPVDWEGCQSHSSHYMSFPGKCFSLIRQLFPSPELLYREPQEPSSSMYDSFIEPLPWVT